MPKISVIILAGGKSSRMGENKALIKINNKPLLTRTYEIAIKISQYVYIVSPWSEQYKLIIPKNCQFIQEEKNKFSGPLIAFYQGLFQVKTEWVLLLACDLPLLDFGEIKNWLNYLPKINSQTIAFLPKNKKGWEVLCGFYRRNCLSSLQAFINEGGVSFQKWLKSNSVAEVPINNSQVLYNCNTKKHLNELLNLL